MMTLLWNADVRDVLRLKRCPLPYALLPRELASARRDEAPLLHPRPLRIASGDHAGDSRGPLTARADGNIA